MTSVTRASIAYVATQVGDVILIPKLQTARRCLQVRFSLSSASIFCRTDKETDSETFYTSLVELFEDPEEQDEVKDMLTWWNRQIFPSFSTSKRVIPANSVYFKMKAKRAALNSLDTNRKEKAGGGDLTN
jgi:hypothetical protein